MRILFNNPPPSAAPAAGVNPGRPIRQPGRWASAILASMSGLVLLFIPVGLSIVHSYLFREGESNPPADDHIIPWVGMAVILILSILAHEWMHTLLYPDGGRSDSTILILNWKKLQFGAYYEGRIPRGRWIAMRLLPLLILTAVPQAALMLFYGGISFAVETYLIILILTNSLGSGGDLVAVGIVLRQVPPGGILNFHRGRAYWLPG
ncbi:MAG: DUF3267 domain-containing protein [Anaerolineales bacterium]|nr:DUF3267 domain-containing protein [Anaerolineales bacterium]